MLRLETGYRVLESEGGHIGFAPTDDLEDRMLQRFRAEFGRVSAERLISGLGLCNIHAHLRAEQGLPVQDVDARTLWSDGLEGRDALASQAIDLFCAMLGSFAGDCALLSGARSVVIGEASRRGLVRGFDESDFMARFLAKGRLGRALEDVSVHRWCVMNRPARRGAGLREPLNSPPTEKGATWAPSMLALAADGGIRRLSLSGDGRVPEQSGRALLRPRRDCQKSRWKRTRPK